MPPDSAAALTVPFAPNNTKERSPAAMSSTPWQHLLTLLPTDGTDIDWPSLQSTLLAPYLQKMSETA